tara:strand:- start:178 stop:582 length:405 start_codon:yes stop_codon:yes gene_type:complete
MQVDDLILTLVKMGYKKGEAVKDENGYLDMKYPKGEPSFIIYQDPTNDTENDEWGIDVRTEDSWKHSGHNPLINFYCQNGSVDSYIFLDAQKEEQFLWPTQSEPIESLGDLTYLLEKTFRFEVEKFVRTTNAKN